MSVLGIVCHLILYFPVNQGLVFSKIMELAILEDSSKHEFNRLQFGFVEKRGNNTAICLANDVIQYCNKRFEVLQNQQILDLSFLVFL